MDAEQEISQLNSETTRLMLTEPQTHLLFLISISKQITYRRLALLQYFCDIMRHGDVGELISGTSTIYIRTSRGPEALGYEKDIESLEKKGFVKLQQETICTDSMPITTLCWGSQATVRYVLEKTRSHQTEQIKRLLEESPPCDTTSIDQAIAFTRTNEFVQPFEDFDSYVCESLLRIDKPNKAR